MLVLFYTMWCVAGLLTAAAACRMVQNGITRRYWLLTTYLVLYSIRYLALAVFWHRQAAYSSVYELTMAPIIALECAAIVSVFFILVENYKAFRRVAIAGMVILVVIGIVAAWFTRHLGTPEGHGIRVTVVLWQRYGSLILVGLLAGIALLLPRTEYLPLRVSAQRAMAILTIDSAEGLLEASLTLILMGWTAHAPLWARWTVTCLPFVFRAGIGLLWLFWMTPASDADPVIVQLSSEEIERRRIEIADRARLLIAEVRDVERRLGDPS